MAPNNASRSLRFSASQTHVSRGTRSKQSPQDGREPLTFPAKVRIDAAVEATYYRHGGILPYALRALRYRT